MEYTTEELDRSTGNLKLVSTGDWITVTELGERYGVGPRTARSVLHHIGLLAPEGHHGRYRLAQFAVERGYGKRIKPKKSKWPFDVISPLGQRLIAGAWAQAVEELAGEIATEAGLAEARAALERLYAQRITPFATEGAVRFLRSAFPTLTNRAIAAVLGVSEQMVGRYVKRQERQIERARARRQLKNLCRCRIARFRSLAAADGAGPGTERNRAPRAPEHREHHGTTSP